ncbi:MAG TPA: glycosyltransferase family 87 protein [Candidatus Aquilonibacter sp.]|nr:glycosyltransferase family 87 protein [Candidatus Aquilonibacter sp.]
MIARTDLDQWHEGRAWLTNAILCALGAGLLWLAHDFTVEHLHFRIGFSGASGWSDWLYVAAIAIVLTQPVNRATLWIVLSFGVAFQMVTLRAQPFLSSDIYRYVWDGMVQHAHISPYRYVPANKALALLQQRHPEIYENINRKEYAHTIYPPVAQMVYWLVTLFSQSVRGMKIAMFGFECVTAAALIALLKRMGRRTTDVLLFAWCPLLVWEIGGSGHVDAVILAFVALALLFRYREQPVMAGLFLGLAVMTKFYPLVLLPALWKRWDWKMPATVVGVCAVGYAMYASVGRLVFGFLGGYAKEEGIDSGTRYFLLDDANRVRGLEWVTKTDYIVFCAVVFGVIAAWAWRYASTERLGREVKIPRPAFVRGSMMLAMALMLLFSPHYPWYIAWLVPLLALDVNWVTLTYVCAFFYGFTTRWADPGPKMFVLNHWIYFVVACAFAVQTLWSQGGMWRWFDCRGEANAT